MPPPITTLLQETLGADYRLEQELEGGGMSRLFFATDVRLNRRVVVKVLPPDLLTELSTARFQREIEFTVRLQHPHILPILTSGSWSGGLYYITPHIAGESLRARIDRDGKLPLDDVLSLLQDIVGALAFAHSRQVVHRDVKPGNVLLSDGHAILADFGIARATTTTTATPITESGALPGTPAYMPPELFATNDGDLYALGVVAYEMLTGALPKRGPTAAEIVAARGSMPGDSPARLRGLARIVAKAIAREPSARFASAPEFRAALDGARSMRASSRWLIAAGAALMIGAAVTTVVLLRRSGPTLNPDRYLVQSAEGADSVAMELSARVVEALQEWRGLTASAAAGAARQQGAARNGRPLRDAIADARRVSARNLVLVEARRDGDSVIARLTLVDASNDTAVRGQRLALGSVGEAGARVMATRSAVNALLRSRSELPWRGAADHTAPSLAAWRSYDAGRASIDQWDLAAAERHFRDAITADRELAQAHLWLAQTIAWSTRRFDGDARGAVRRALDLGDRLTAADVQRATGLLALGERRFADACRSFGSVVSADSADLSGWLGLGDCAAQNHTVERNPRSGTRWSFQSSYEAAARAYQRAAELGSIASNSDFRGWVLGRLSSVLYAVTNKVRMGYAATQDTVTFAALPFLDHDTLAFAPYDVRELASGRFDPPPRSVEQAVVRNRELLRRSAEEWVRRAPQNPAAYDSLAGWMEVSSGMATIGERELSTIEVVHRALALSSDSTERLRLAISEVRLLIKDARFADARAKADSLLKAGASRRAHDVAGVAGLAALLGRVEDVAQLNRSALDSLHTSDGRIVVLSPQIAGAASRLVAYAAFSPANDSVPVIAQRTAGLVDSYFPDSSVASRVRGTLIGSALSLSYPEGSAFLATLRVEGDETTRAFGLLARGDTTGARRLLVAVQQMNEGRSVGTAIDRNLRRARLALALHDTAYALRELDPALRALPTLGPSLLDQVPQTVGLIRAFALRAELAALSGDRATAAQCASAVVTLWSDAEPMLTPILTRMKTLARTMT